MYISIGSLPCIDSKRLMKDVYGIPLQLRICTTLVPLVPTMRANVERSGIARKPKWENKKHIFILTSREAHFVTRSATQGAEIFAEKERKRHKEG